MAHYRFDSEWKLTAPIEQVFDLLSRPGEFSRWWPSVTRSRLLEDGDETGVGRRAVYRLRSPLLYSMNFVATAVEVIEPRLIRTLVRGDLIGTGTYELNGDEQSTTVRLLWHVSTSKRWMNLVTPLARPLFVWAHHHVMREGAAAMASRLGARLLATRTRLEEEPRLAAEVETQR